VELLDSALEQKENGVNSRGVWARTSFASAEALYRAEYRRLLRLLTVAAPDPETAADVLQEAFVQLHVKWKHVAEHENQVGWVMRVALNRLRNQERSLRRRAAALIRVGEGEATSLAPRPEGRLDLVRAIKRLPARRRLILALYYFEDRPVAQIANLLGISEGSVTRQLHRAREALKKDLGEQE